ncbi:MAG: NAD(P)-binding domain-containing protein [Solirubrobacterales bacterium]|nr:NAD(P)-binding domain-containing protein [Solirubrobacterales bacterium]
MNSGGAHPTSAIGIVGAGRMAGGIARRLATAGRSVHVYDRDSESARALADALSAAGYPAVQSRPLDAVLAAPVVILAIRFPATLEFAREHAPSSPATYSWISRPRSIRATSAAYSTPARAAPRKLRMPRQRPGS